MYGSREDVFGLVPAQAFLHAASASSGAMVHALASKLETLLADTSSLNDPSCSVAPIGNHIFIIVWMDERPVFFFAA